MKKYLFVIARYNDVRQNWFDEKISPRNREYCERHGFKYIEVRGEHQVESFRNNPTWWKFQEFVEKFTHSTNFQKECYSDYLGKEANAEKQRVKNAILAEKAGKAKVSKASWKKELY